MELQQFNNWGDHHPPWLLCQQTPRSTTPPHATPTQPATKHRPKLATTLPHPPPPRPPRINICANVILLCERSPPNGHVIFTHIHYILDMLPGLRISRLAA